MSAFFDPASDSDETVMEWHSEDESVVIRRHPGTEYRDGEHKPIDLFGLFYKNALVCDGSWAYVSNYFWNEFA